MLRNAHLLVLPKRAYHTTTHSHHRFRHHLNGIVKMEFPLHRPEDLTQARQMVNQSVQIYNRERPYTALQYKMPDEVHRVLH